MKAAPDITGQRFGNLIVLGVVGSGRGKDAKWNVRCDCGVEKTVSRKIREGKIKSCGCLRRDRMRTMVGNRHPKHGGARRGNLHPLYATWSGMKDRCLNLNSHAFEDYGARGIKICDRWMKFENFLADMGDKPTGTSIDRIDVNGNYEPGNCRWATAQVQGANTRRARIIELKGESRCISDWARRTGLSPITITRRLNAGFSPEKILEPTCKKS